MDEKPSIFISYAKEDISHANRLFVDLQNKNADPWLDRKKLVAGDDWNNVIRSKIRTSKYFIALLSNKSVSKQGYVQKEIREAIDVRNELPEGKRFIIPMRIEECNSSFEVINKLHWIDLFPQDKWDIGITELLTAINLKNLVNQNIRNHKEKRLKIDLSDSLRQTIDELALDNGLSKSEMIRRGIALMDIYAQSRSNGRLTITSEDKGITKEIEII